MNKTILLVDDERPILKSLSRLLEDTDFDILQASNGQDALELIKNHNVAVIVSDNMMPGMSGVDLLSTVKNISPDTIRILLTGYADLDTALKAINESSVYKFVTKPWDNDSLVSLLRDAVLRFDFTISLRTGDESTLRSLGQTIELKDHYTKGHCDSVAKYALIIAEALNLPNEMQTHIKHGSWLHDCGKIGVPEAILNKEGPLDDKEFEIIKNHPGWGADVAKQAQLNEAVINIILYHHEKYDGTGYQTRLAGDKIPLEARIVSVADVFDAITTDRSYRKKFDTEKAISIMQDNNGTAFDPNVLKVFLKNIDKI